jgi:hypothetical protein
MALRVNGTVVVAVLAILVSNRLAEDANICRSANLL